MDLSDIIPPRDYEFRMGLRRGDPAEFFRPGVEHAEVTDERQRWLQEDPSRYAGLMSGSEPLLDEADALFREWGVISPDPVQPVKTPWDRLLSLGCSLEPDLLFLAPDEEGALTLKALCVCFPSSWSPAEKLGRPMHVIHEPAPRLNSSLGAQIDTFLARLQPGIGWLRFNWGLSSSPERNQHPDRSIPRLHAGSYLQDAWLRVERQCLLALPTSRGVLFAIRIESLNLESLRSESREISLRLANALRTMPEDIASYKGIAAAREPLARQLSDDRSGVN